MLPQNVFLPDILEGARMQDASAILADVPEGGSITAAQLTSASAMLAPWCSVWEEYPAWGLLLQPGTPLDSMSTLQPWQHAFTHLCPGSAEHPCLATCSSAVSPARQQRMSKRVSCRKLCSSLLQYKSCMTSCATLWI